MKKFVFFSGGTALGRLASYLAPTDMRPAYIITTFDSGGSTQALRKVIAIPAVGDLRNRLLAATDAGVCPQKLIQFLKWRIGADQSFQDARRELCARITNGGLEDLPEWTQVKADLDAFLANMPHAFDARHASMGNLALAGNWFANGHSLKTALACYKDLLHIKAEIIPVCEQNLHLGFRLANGQTFIGQHLLHKELPAPVSHIFLTNTAPWHSDDCSLASEPIATAEAVGTIAQADAICFPMGSFFSSLLVTLLPAGVGNAVAGSRATKIYIPNSGYDIELAHLDLISQIEIMLDILKSDAPNAKTQDLLNAVLLDSVNGQYQLTDLSACANYLAVRGIAVHDRRIISPDGKHDPAALLDSIEELA